MASSFFFGRNKKKTEDRNKKITEDTFSAFLWNEKPLIVKASYQTLLEITDGFSSTNLIGVGSFGSVYKGILDGEIVAIKVLNNQRQGASKSFMAECEALGIIRHRNLVKLITACSTIDFQGNGFKALIYKFMPFGNLDWWLHSVPENNGTALNLCQRLNIALDVAYALEYLHHYCPKPIIHCDLKPSNVLLDQDLVAHVGDFGLAKFLPEFPDLNQRNLIRTRGTTGYAPPEYGQRDEVSAKGDVYSYGILLLEMMTRKKPTDRMFKEGLDHQTIARVALPGIVLLEVLTGKRPILDDDDDDDDFDLHSFARKALPGRVMEIVDPILLKDIEKELVMECLISMVRIGVACTMESPQDRMEIRKVIRELHLIRDILQGTRKHPMLNLRMTQLPSFEKSYCQEDPKSYSHKRPWFPNLEIFYAQEEPKLYSQSESSFDDCSDDEPFDDSNQ